MMDIKRYFFSRKYIALVLLIEIITVLILINLNVSFLVLFLNLITFIAASTLFISNNISTETKVSAFHKKYSSELKTDEENITLNNYEEKIIKVNAVLEEMKYDLEKNLTVPGFAELFDSFNIVAKRLLNELNTAKIFKVNRNEFLGNVAHELRTPIFAIQLSLETLEDGAINDPKVSSDFLGKAIRQSNRLKELVDDLISISKFEAGMKFSKRYFLINTLINETVVELDAIAARKNIHLSFDSGTSDNTRVFADSERIKQVLINLIDNSAKYTPEEGKITIRTKSDGEYVSIKVEDTGLGIPKEDLPRIFERFYRVDKTRSRDMGGSGLGLSIVKHILELHNSLIKVESEVDKGTSFEFKLPV